jgi:hypothetical protein
MKMKEGEIENKLNEVNRVEIINHGNNTHPFGRFLVMKTKELNEGNSINSFEFSIQDDGKTLKIFID